MTSELLTASAHDTGLPDKSCHMICTSPPYWGLRKYAGEQGIDWPAVSYSPMPGLPELHIAGCDPECEHEWAGSQLKVGKVQHGTGKSTLTGGHESWGNRDGGTQGACCIHCGGWHGELGLEPTPEAYVGHMVLVFREMWRVLRDDGTAFVNLGDSYFGGGAQHAASYGTSGKEPGDFQDRGCLCGSLCDVCREVYYHKSRIDDLLGPMLIASLSAPIRESMGFANGHLPTSDFDHLGGRIFPAIRDWLRFQDHGAERLPAFLESMPDEFSQQLLGVCLQRANDSSCLLCGRSLDACVLASDHTLGDSEGLCEHTQDTASRVAPRGSRNQSTDTVCEYCSVPYNPPTHIVPQSTLKPKDLCGMPWRVAFALQADGWYLRSDIIWSKKNPMPSSVRDRPTTAHEYLFLLAKNKKYYYDQEAIAESAKYAGDVKRLGEKSLSRGQAIGMGRQASGNGIEETVTVAATRNRRTVWHIATQPTPHAHFACVDEQTQCLTVSGWKTYQELTIGEQIGVYDMDKQVITFTTLEDIAAYPVIEQPMIKLRGRSLDQLLTPNHRCVLRRRSGKDVFVRADELVPSNSVIVAAPWKYNGKDFPPRLAALLGWYVTEGSYGKDCVHIYQSESANPEYCQEIRQLLNDEGATYSEYVSNRKYKGRPNKAITWRITGAVANILLGLSPKKRLPAGYLGWNLESLQVLWDALMKGDGHFREANRQTFVQKDYKLISQVQALGTRLGYATTLRKRSQGTHALYKTESNTRRLASETTGLISQELYTGVVWCPQTPYGTFVARRNGYVFITGNTYPEKLVEPCIRAGTRPGDTVLDPFSGSGTTGRVAMRLNRNYIGIDISQEYHDTIAKERLGNVQRELPW